MKFIPTLVALSALAALANSAEIPMKSVRAATPKRIRWIGADGQFIGPWQSATTPSDPLSKSAGNLKVVWDGTNSNPATVDGPEATWLNSVGAFYGVDTNLRTFGGTNYAVSAPSIYDDMTLASGSAGQIVTWMTYGFLYNPSATTTSPSGTANLAVVVKIGSSVGRDTLASPQSAFNGGNLYSAVAIDFGAQDSGAYFTRFFLGQRGLALPNWGTGGLLIQGYTYATAFNSLSDLQPMGSKAFQTTVQHMYSSADSTHAGTNPSTSSKYLWLDYSSVAAGANGRSPDYSFQSLSTTGNVWTENVNSDVYTTPGDATIGSLDASAGLFYDPTRRTISGVVTFGSVPASPARALPSSMLVVIKDGSGTDFRNPTIDPITGAYKILDHDFDFAYNGSTVTYDSTPVAGGPRQISARLADTFLRKVIAVDTSGGSVSNANFSLTNGDADGNNIVNINDYAILSDAFNKSSADSDWSTPNGNGFAPYRADFDHNNIVNINDYAILSDNFNLSGDSSLDTTLDP